MYHPYKINELIYSIKSGLKKIEIDKTINEKMQYSMYDYYLYNLVLLHFINVFNAQRNVSMRKNIITLLSNVDFNKNIDEVRDFLKEIKDIDDNLKLKNIIGRYITVHHDKKKMFHDIEVAYFNFDKMTLDKLKNMPVNKVNDELHKIAKDFVKIGRISTKNFNFPNILIRCTNKNSQTYCEGDKLIIEKKKLDDILDIISHDIINPSKWKWIFSSVFIDKFVDYFKFIRRKDEYITVDFLS